ncbi:HNH endonuclease [Variovorax sp. Varisp41]|uniref:HNH endonuclease n=1 Tax=Variovorax sp. Varisp41 TaxID=3243033 RepID=UPI0039B589EC
MTTPNTDAQPAEPVRIHTPPMDLADNVRFLGFITGRTLVQHQGAPGLGLAISDLDELRVLLAGIFTDEALEVLEREGVLEIEGISFFLLSEGRSTSLPSMPVLALALSPEKLGGAHCIAEATYTVFVPRTVADLENYLSIYPMSGAVQIQRSVPELELTEAHRERSDWFEERYETIAYSDFGPESSTTYLGQDAQRRCRYCGDTSPDVTFSTKAHAFPEQIGNKALIDLNECDRCNKHFSKWVEDDFGKWTLPMRSLGRVNGKGIPTFQSSDKAFRVEAQDAKNLKIRLAKDDPRHVLDMESNTVTLKLERQPYVPMGVFKCLVKMALAVMPQEEALACEHLKKWILQESHTFESYPYRPLNIYTQFLPGPLPNDRFQYCLLRRRAQYPEFPFMIFVLQFSNLVLQIILPMHKEDRAIIEAGKFEMALFPHLGGLKEHEDTYGPSGSKTIDMSGFGVVRREHETMNFHFDKMIDTSNAPSDRPV